jgi:hypothetical protein
LKENANPLRHLTSSASHARALPYVQAELRVLCDQITPLLPERLGTPAASATLPRRCQYWFKVGDRYFLSDSDTDRQARVFARTIKP